MDVAQEGQEVKRVIEVTCRFEIDNDDDGSVSMMQIEDQLRTSMSHFYVRASVAGAFHPTLKTLHLYLKSVIVKDAKK